MDKNIKILGFSYNQLLMIYFEKFKYAMYFVHNENNMKI